MNEIEAFLAGSSFAVAGASRDRSKYGNMVLRALMRAGYAPIPINPHEAEIEGRRAYPDLQSAPTIESLAIITPPAVTEMVVKDAIAAGVHNLWMQPGAESAAAIDQATEAGLMVVAGGPCLLVVLGFRGDSA